jgi:hypothetical protein
MAAWACIGGVGLLRNADWANRACLLAASAMVFLSLLDITFNVENSLYRLILSSADMAIEAIINLWTLGLGILTTIVVWRWWPTVRHEE